jgi:hypothetical protein
MGKTRYGTRDRFDVSTYPAPGVKSAGTLSANPNRTFTTCDPCPTYIDCEFDDAGDCVPGSVPGCTCPDARPFCEQGPADHIDCLPKDQGGEPPCRCPDEIPSQTEDKCHPCLCFEPRCGCNPDTDPTCCPKNPALCP